MSHHWKTVPEMKYFILRNTKTQRKQLYFYQCNEFELPASSLLITHFFFFLIINLTGKLTLKYAYWFVVTVFHKRTLYIEYLNAEWKKSINLLGVNDRTSHLSNTAEGAYPADFNILFIAIFPADVLPLVFAQTFGTQDIFWSWSKQQCMTLLEICQ